MLSKEEGLLGIEDPIYSKNYDLLEDTEESREDVRFSPNMSTD